MCLYKKCNIINKILERKFIMNNIIIKESEQQALDLDILKSHLRIDYDHEDNYLKEIISMATDILEKNIEKPILVKTFKYVQYNSEFTSTKKIFLPLNNVKEILSVRSLGQQCESLKYAIENYNGRTVIITNGSRYPIEIIYRAGITEKFNEIPKDLQFAILQISKNIYECSEEDVLESKYIKHIINSNRSLNID